MDNLPEDMQDDIRYEEYIYNLVLIYGLEE